MFLFARFCFPPHSLAFVLPLSFASPFPFRFPFEFAFDVAFACSFPFAFPSTLPSCPLAPLLPNLAANVRTFEPRSSGRGGFTSYLRSRVTVYVLRLCMHDGAFARFVPLCPYRISFFAYSSYSFPPRLPISRTKIPEEKVFWGPLFCAFQRVERRLTGASSRTISSFGDKFSARDEGLGIF